MHVIAIDRTGMNDHLMRARRLTQQFAAANPNVPTKDWVTILRHPNHVVFAVPKRYGCHACTLLSTQSNADALRSQPPKGVGFPDPLSGTLKQAHSCATWIQTTC